MSAWKAGWCLITESEGKRWLKLTTACFRDFIREAKEAGVEMRVCSAALQLHEMTEDDLIEECDGVVGAAYMVDVGLESGMVLNY